MTTDLDRLIDAVERGDRPTVSAKRLSPVGRWSAEIDSAFSGSMDAALRLHNALLPGWVFDLTNGSCFVCPKGATGGGGDEFPQFSAENDVHSRAWLLSILLAYRETTK